MLNFKKKVCYASLYQPAESAITFCFRTLLSSPNKLIVEILPWTAASDSSKQSFWQGIRSHTGTWPHRFSLLLFFSFFPFFHTRRPLSCSHPHIPETAKRAQRNRRRHPPREGSAPVATLERRRDSPSGERCRSSWWSSDWVSRLKKLSFHLYTFFYWSPRGS
jgi:hypothetical protein